ncbi:MAG TPA: Nif3-like dinuclear metal center hexameric protein [Puia sp.]|nr:Nif3-like dinuclear metal center hexameric protein [Puia sp.]
MKILEIIQHLEDYASPDYQEDYDNSGLITGDIRADCSGVLLSLDCTEELITEAVEKKCNLIVSHHPLIFHPIRRIIPENGVGKALISAIKKDITIYSIHTNLDNVIGGVNARIADKIGLQNRKILSPGDGDTTIGSGMIGDLKLPVSETQVLKQLKESFRVPVIRHSALTGKPISRIAICGGAGSFLISNALQERADWFVSSDIRYHEFFSGEGKMVIADIGHFESEQFTVDLLHDVILEKFPNFAVLKSGIVTNPVNYYI